MTVAPEPIDTVETVPALPPRWRFRVDPSTLVAQRDSTGAVLLGGQPWRVLRLQPSGDRVYQALDAGATLAEAASEAKVTLRAATALVRRLLDAGLLHPLLGSSAIHDVTVVIPARDRATAVGRLLRAIGTDVAVIVVDDGSRDSTAAMASATGARVLNHERSLGASAARNTGALAADTAFVAFVDSDCVPEAGWLAELLGHFDDPTVAAVAPRIIGLETGKQANALHAYELARSPLDLGDVPARVVPLTRVAYVPSAALVVRRRVFAAVGGFDADRHVGEDVDLVWRLLAAGHNVRYEPRACVAHDHRTQLPAFVRRRYDYGTSAAHLAKDHPGLVPPAVLSPWTAAPALAAATQTLPGLIAAPVLAAAARRNTKERLKTVPASDAIRSPLLRRAERSTVEQLASLLTRTWGPATLAAALVSPRTRRLAVAAAVVPNVIEWRRSRPPIGAATFVGLRVLDDLAYGVGVWSGCARHRTTEPLRPVITNWPRHRADS